MSGFWGSCATSAAPVRASTYSVLVQVLPPSVVRYTPRSGLSLNSGPVAATSTVSGRVGWITMRAMRSVFSRPMRVHVSPPSVVLYTPSP